jgi:uncharacterized membrane protein SirB2
MMGKHLATTLLLCSWLVICTIIFYKLHVEATWCAYLAVIFFFNSHFDTGSLKTIFGSGAMGLAIGYAMPHILATLTPIFGAETAFYLLVFIVLGIIIGLGPIAHHSLFNPITFAYALLVLLHIGEAATHTLEWIAIHFFGGALCIVGIIGVVKLMNRNESTEKENHESA